MTKFVLVYVTFPDRQSALKVVRHLVKLKLIACANVLDSITSVYEWRGKIVEDAECVVIMKTLRSYSKQLITKIKKIHRYECPCIVEVPIEGGNEQFLEWIDKQLQP